MADTTDETPPLHITTRSEGPPPPDPSITPRTHIDGFLKRARLSLTNQMGVWGWINKLESNAVAATLTGVRQQLSDYITTNTPVMVAHDDLRAVWGLWCLASDWGAPPLDHAAIAATLDTPEHVAAYWAQVAAFAATEPSEP